jgi:hypothetical protein
MPTDDEPGATPDQASPGPTSSVVTAEVPSDQQVQHGVPCKGESRWSVIAVVFISLAIDAVIPHMALGPAWFYRASLVALLIPLFLGFAPNPRIQRWARYLSLAILTCLAWGNVLALVLVLTPILDEQSTFSGHWLIMGAVYIWLVNILVLGITYWELDRGGPKARLAADHRSADLLFPQMGSPGIADRSWAPKFTDYMYVSLTNAMAFSPADSLPLTRACKYLMAFQSLVSLLTFALVAGRAINILSQG